MMPGGIGVDQNTVTLSIDGGPDCPPAGWCPAPSRSRCRWDAGPHRIAWHFAKAGILPKGDDRGVVAHMISLTTVPGSIEKDADSSTAEVDAILGDPTRSYSGIQGDGWIDRDGFVGISADRPGKVQLHAVVPPGIGIGKDEVKVSVEGGESVYASLRARRTHDRCAGRGRAAYTVVALRRDRSPYPTAMVGRLPLC